MTDAYLWPDEVFQRMKRLGFSDEQAYDAAERAAIMEICGKVPRGTAEMRAMREQSKRKNGT